MWDGGSVDEVIDLIDRVHTQKAPLVISRLTGDYNHIDEAIINPFSLFRIAHYILWPLAVYCVYYSITLTSRYIRNKKYSFSYCSFSLITHNIASILRVARLVDMIGVSKTS